jgi:hypothetical protein
MSARAYDPIVSRGAKMVVGVVRKEAWNGCLRRATSSVYIVR